jgi:hypothetical protein
MAPGFNAAAAGELASIMAKTICCRTRTSKQNRKQFFFKKKNQKTFIRYASGSSSIFLLKRR